MDKLSFELFPPRSEAKAHSLNETINELKRYVPDYFSVTFGAADGSTDGTIETVKKVSVMGLSVVPHITNKINTVKKLEELLKIYSKLNVKSAVVIKGDGTNSQKSEFKCSTDLLKAIHKLQPNLKLIVACYPEFHPLGTVMSEVDTLKHKHSLGAHSAITQFFYNFDAYQYYLDILDKNNIDIPITVGILPIDNYQKIKIFSDKCGADIPRWLASQMEHYSSDPDSQIKLGIELVSSLMIKIKNLKGKYNGFHIYTLNQHKIISRILDNVWH